MELGFSKNEELGIDELKKIENYLKDYQIIVFDSPAVNADSMNCLMYVGITKEKKMFLYYHYKHLDTIKSFPAFYHNKNYCFDCMKPYNNFENHPCNLVCKKCKDRKCQKTENKN